MTTPTAAPPAAPAAPPAAPPPAAPAAAPPAIGADGKPVAVPPGTTPPAAPPPTTPEVPKEQPVARKLARVAEREAAARDQSAKIQAEREGWAAQRKQLEQEAAEAKRLRALKGNPRAFAQELGMTPQEFLEIIAKGESSTDPAVLQAIQEARAETAEVKKQLAEKQQQEAAYRQQQQVAQYSGRVAAIIEKGGERFDFVRAEGIEAREILQVAAELAKQRPPRTAADEDALLEQVLDKAETWLEQKYQERITKAPKWAKKFAPKPPEPAPAAPPAAKTPPPRTLTNSQQAAPASSLPVKKGRTREDDVAFVKEKFADLIKQASTPPKEKKP